VLFDKLMYIIIPTNAHRISIKLILKLLRHVAVFLQHPTELSKFLSTKVTNYWNDQIQQHVVMVKLIVGKMWKHMQFSSAMNNMEYNTNMW